MDVASQRIAEKLAARILPGTEPGATWRGIGPHCDGCEASPRHRLRSPLRHSSHGSIDLGAADPRAS